MIVHCRATPSILSLGPIIHLGGDKQFGVKFLAKGNNVMAKTQGLTSALAQLLETSKNGARLVNIACSVVCGLAENF